MTSSVRPGELLTLDVERVGQGGVCVARHDGLVVFVRGALPDEQVTATVTQVNSRFLRADTVDVLRPSQFRVVPPCRYAGECGGCDWQHADMDYQRELKARVVREHLGHLGGVAMVNGRPLAELQVAAISDSPLRWRTRNRFQITSPRGVGMFRARSTSVVDVDDCLIAMEGAVHAARQAIPLVSSLGKREVSLVSHTPTDHTVVDSRGGPITSESVKGRTFRIHASSFWQVHRGAPASLVDAVASYATLSAGESVADLYSGSGLFSGCLAPEVGEQGRVVAVESAVDAVRDARRSLADLPQVELVTADVADWLVGNRDVFDVVLLDPPRAGLGLNSVPHLARAARRAIVYVACESSALARDCAALRGQGWDMTSLTCLDLFPMTHHVESVALFVRVG